LPATSSALIGELRADGANYKVIELKGEIVRSLSIESRFTLCNMLVEAGAKSTILEVDGKTTNWLKKHKVRNTKPIFPDKGAYYSQILEFDISHLEPQIAKPHRVDNVVPISKIEGKKIDQAFLGTCTNGRLEDLRIAASAIEGRITNPLPLLPFVQKKSPGLSSCMEFQNLTR